MHLRDLAVACLIGKGHSNAEIAALLFVSESAIKKHISSLLEAGGFHNRTQLALAADRLIRELGIPEPEDFREWYNAR